MPAGPFTAPDPPPPRRPPSAPGDEAGQRLHAQEVRLGTMLGVARRHGARLSAEELVLLLPEGPLRSPSDVQRWLLEHGGGAPEAVGTPAARPQAADAAATVECREELARRRWVEAREEVPRLLEPVLGLLRSIVVTGSVSYGSVAEDDDLDFFVVTRRGGLWLFLLYAYLVARWSPRPGRPVWCFNHVLDERMVRARLSGPGDLLEARELLLARPVLGGTYYRDLLGGLPWVREALPRLAKQWDLPVVAGLPPPRPLPWPVRLLNAGGFLTLGPYLQVMGLWRSWRLEGRGAPMEAFRTITRPGQLTLLSRKFEAVRALYRQEEGAPAPGPTPPARPPEARGMTPPTVPAERS